MTAWIVRARKVGERDAWVLHGAQGGGGFEEVPDLTKRTDRDAPQGDCRGGVAGDSSGRINNFVGQLWALRTTIKPGNLIVLPLKTTKKIAIGVCTAGYQYRSDEPHDRGMPSVGLKDH